MIVHVLGNIIGSTIKKISSKLKLFFLFKKNIVFVDDITLMAEQEVESNTDWELKNSEDGE